MKKHKRILFWGNFIPLQGVEYIIKAARLLADEPNIHFTLVGDGQTKEDIVRLAHGMPSVTFVDKRPITDLPPIIADSDICLGIFGNTEKARRVIPNKAYGTIAMGKPLITGDSPAIRELFTNGKNALFCCMANAEDLAMKIRVLLADERLRHTIAQGGYELYRTRLTPARVVEPLLVRLSTLSC